MDTEDVINRLKYINDNLLFQIETEEEAKFFIKNLRAATNTSLLKGVYSLGESSKSMKKISKALTSYAYIGALGTMEYPLVVIDTTLFGSADDGCLISTKGVYFSRQLEGKSFVSFNEIKNIKYKEYTIYINQFSIEFWKSDISQYYCLIKKIVEIFQNPKLKEKTVAKIFNNKAVESYLEAIIELYSLNCGKDVYYLSGGEVFNSKVNYILKRYDTLSINEFPIVFYDATIYHNGENGCLVTTKGIFICNHGKESVFFDYRNSLNTTIFNRNIYINGYKLDNYCMNNGELKCFKKLLNLICEKFHSLKPNFNVHYNLINKQDNTKNLNDKKLYDEYHKISIEECYTILDCTSINSFLEIREQYNYLLKQYDPSAFKDCPQEFIDLANKKSKILDIVYHRIIEEKKN